MATKRKNSRVLKDWTGHIFGSSTVLGFFNEYNNANQRLWKVQCACGSLRSIPSQNFKTISGKCKKCNQTTTFAENYSHFMDKVSPEPNTGCWFWEGSVRHDGYGQVVLGGKPWAAHRASYTYHIGIIPEGLHILHSCDQPTCVNPDHLRVGTHADNMVDKTTRCRASSLYGEANGQSKLTEEDVKTIRKLYSTGVIQRIIADSFGVSHQTISRIVRKERWEHV